MTLNNSSSIINSLSKIRSLLPPPLLLECIPLQKIGFILINNKFQFAFRCYKMSCTCEMLPFTLIRQQSVFLLTIFFLCMLSSPTVEKNHQLRSNIYCNDIPKLEYARINNLQHYKIIYRRNHDKCFLSGKSLSHSFYDLIDMI